MRDSYPDDDLQEEKRRKPLTDALIDEVCRRVASGIPLKKICEDPAMPARSTFLRGVVTDTPRGILARYTDARHAQGYSDADRIREVADMLILDEDLDGRRVQALKVALDALKWSTERNASSVYGARIHQEISGPNGGPVQLTDMERAAKIAALIDRAARRARELNGIPSDGLPPQASDGSEFV